MGGGCRFQKKFGPYYFKISLRQRRTGCEIFGNLQKCLEIALNMGFEAQARAQAQAQAQARAQAPAPKARSPGPRTNDPMLEH